MKTVTNDFKNKIKLNGRQIDALITYTLNNEDIELGNETLNSICPHYNGNLLKSVMKQLEIDSNEDIPVGTEINFQFGVRVRNNDVEDYRDNYDYVNYGNYIVYSSEKQEDVNSYKIVCYDKMLYSMKDYEFLNITYPISIRDYISAICNKLGLTFKNTEGTFANYNRIIQSELYLSYNEDEEKWESLGYTFRDVLDEIAQVTASTICINEEDDELEIRYINDTNEVIDEESLKDVNVNFGEMCGPYNTIVLSRSGGSDKIYKSYPDDLPEEDRIAIEIADNQIMNWNDRSDYLPDILDRITNLSYSINDFSSTGICYLNLCDAYTITIGENNYYCVMLNDEVEIEGGLVENIHTDKMEESVTDYSKADKTDRKLNQTYLIVDKQNQEITSVVSSVDEQNTKISRLTQRVDSLESEITEIADMTISGETTLGRMSLDDVIQSVPISLRIRPVVTNIDKLYPSTTLYPSTSLYPKVKIIRFTNTDTSEVFEYEIPDSLLYYDSETYDEFYLNGNEMTCRITKKCKYNADGSVGLLDEEVITEYPFPETELYLTDGDYIIELLGYNSAYIMTRLLGKNIYTDQFYTKVETNSKISQSASQIMSEVSQTYSTIDTANTLSSRITQKASSIELVTTDNSTSAGITIRLKNENGTQLDSKSANITLSGKVAFADLSTSGRTTINGANITTGTIDASKVNVTNINATNIKSGTIATARLSSDVITTSNFSAQNINASKITTGTMTAGAINLGNGTFVVNTNGAMTATSANITGTINATGGSFTGSLNAGNNNYYVRIGTGWTKHPEVSGLNVYSGGINMHGYGISNVNAISFKGQGSISSVTYPFKILGSLQTTGIYLGSGGFVMSATGSTSETATIECMAANGNHKWKMYFENGILVGAVYSGL